MEDKMIDQSAVANTVSEGIKYEMLDDFLVKLLDPVKVKKEFSTPVVKSTTKDEDGVEAQNYDDVTTEVKEVDSDYREGIIIKVPFKYTTWMNREDSDVIKLNVGDTIVFRATSIRYFDLVKDSVLVKHYDIVAIKKND